MTAGIKAQLLDTFLEKRAEIRRFLIARFRDVEFAEDVLQEVYLKLDRTSLEQDIANQTAYLYRVAYNLAMDLRKQAQRRTVRDNDWQETRTLETSSQDKSPDEKLDQQKKIQKIAEELKRLPPQCRNVFQAHKFEGLSHREVAAKFNISRSTVEKHISKALKHLLLHLHDTS